MRFETTNEVRLPRSGEWYIGNAFFPVQAICDHDKPMDIRRRIVTPIDDSRLVKDGFVQVPVSEIERLRSAVSTFVHVPQWALAAREAADPIIARLPPAPDHLAVLEEMLSRGMLGTKTEHTIQVIPIKDKQQRNALDFAIEAIRKAKGEKT